MTSTMISLFQEASHLFSGACVLQRELPVFPVHQQVILSLMMDSTVLSIDPRWACLWGSRGIATGTVLVLIRYQYSTRTELV